MPMRPTATLLALLLLALPASAQWQRVETFMPVNDLYAINLVGADDAYTYATVLAGQPVPSRFEIVRSADDGASWELVFSGYNGSARGSFLGDLGGQMAVLIQGNGETGLLLSDDQGRTWAETAARLPTNQIANVARDGQTYVVTGGTVSYRSTDGGATWTPLEERAMRGVVFFNGAFHALNSIGQLFRLDGAAWTAVAFGAPFATNLWVDGGTLWVKASAAALYASTDGAAWAAQPTAAPTEWSRALPAPDDGAPWFLTTFGLLLSDDDGATATSIADGYPRDTNGNVCTSTFATTRNAAIGNAWACSFTEPEQNGVFRYVFGEEVAVGPLVPAFGVAGRVTLPLFSRIEHGVAVLPATGTGLAGGGEMLLVGSYGSIARLRPDGSLDTSYGTDGVAMPRLNGAGTAFRLAGGTVLIAGAGGIWRVTADGALDTTYGTDGVAAVQAFYTAVFADGSVVAQGFFNPTGSGTAIGLVKLTPDGAVDTAFGTDGYVFPADRTSATGVTVDGQGRVVALFDDGGSSPAVVYRYTAGGALDATFGTGGIASFPDLYQSKTIATGADDGVLFTARTDSGNGPVQVIRLTEAGGLDAAFGAGGRAEIPGTEDEDDFPKHPSLRDLQVAADGSITAGGSLTLTVPVNDGVRGSQQAYLVRLTADGAMDEAFGDGGQFHTQWSGRHDIVTALAIDADDTILAAGWSDTGFGQQDERAFVLRAFPDVTSGGGNTASEDTPERVARLDVWPNPSRGGATVRLRTEAAGAVAVDLFDTLGRHVARLGDGERAAGEATFVVPSALAPGVYVVRAVVDGRVESRTLTVVR